MGRIEDIKAIKDNVVTGDKNQPAGSNFEYYKNKTALLCQSLESLYTKIQSQK